MKEYDAIAIGSGSAMNILSAMMQRDPNIKVAVIDKDEPGGICLTRGCIPSKILLYPAELVRTIDRAGTFGIDLEIRKVDFAKVMKRMRTLIDGEIESIRQGLTQSSAIDYYNSAAEFVSPYTLKVGNDRITSKMILLCTGSKPIIPPIRGIEEVEYQTSDTILHETQLPRSIAIVGGGYVAAEYGHFLSAMGSKVTIIGRNRAFLPQEESEVSALAKRELGKHMTILTNYEVVQAERTPQGGKRLVAVERQTGQKMEITAEEILIASGRGPNTDILHPERAGIKTDEKGWIVVNEHLETSQPNVWAFGDANGKHLFKHAANYESMVVYYNAVLKRKLEVDYHAVPHAVFTYPEIASVGLRQKEAVERYGEEGILIGFQRYEDTAKGEAMDIKDYFAKVILQKDGYNILGAHIIGPYASVLIQEIINVMYTPDRSAEPILDAMHIHPALSEVVQRAFQSVMTTKEYNHLLEHTHATAA
jgi:mycothione reductase